MASQQGGSPQAGSQARKPGGMRSPVTWIVILGIAVAGGAFLLWRRSSSSSAGTAAATGTAGGTTDYAGQIATLQTEIEDLQSSGAQDKDTGTGTGTGTAGAGGGTGGTGGTGTGAGGGTKPAKVPAMPTSVVGAASGPAAARLSWGKVAGATSYQVRMTYQGKLAGSATVTGTSTTISGLTANHTYTGHVKACNAAGCSSETNGPIIKTPRAA